MTSEVTPQTIQAHLTSNIEGEQIPFSDEELENLTDWARVRKLYKLNSLGNTIAAGSGGKKKDKSAETNGNLKEEKERERKELEVLILSTIALRGSTN